MKKRFNPWIIITGAAVGVAAVALTKLGNPKNMGFCIACFIRDIAGAMKLHSAEVVQYVRPEILGIVLGSFLMALGTREFKAKAGSSPATRFVLGAIVMVGALVFLGCPLRMVLRMAGGDLNAYVGFAGFAIGICIGILFLKRGFSLKRNYPSTLTEGIALPGLAAMLLILAIAAPTLFLSSKKGPGSMHAPLLAALLISLVIGALAQRSRICMVGGMRDAILFRDFNLLIGFGCIFAVALIGNLIFNGVNFSFHGQPVAHEAHLYNLLGMVLVGWGSVLLGGCPLRQLILAGEGSGDSAVTVIGMGVGAALAHNFDLAGKASSTKDGVYNSGGLSDRGKIAVFAGLGILLLISVLNTFFKKEGKKQ